MRDGDVLTVFAVAPQFANAITLRGNVAVPLRHPYTPGMRISDLIPEPEALVARDYYIRKNRMVQYTEERRTDLTVGQADEVNWEYATIERLGGDRLTVSLLPFNLGLAVRLRDPQNDLLLQAGDVVTIFNNKDIRGPQSRGTRLVRVEGEVERPGVYQLMPGETLRALVARAGGLTAQAYVYGLDFSREETRQRQRENLSAAQARLEAMSASQTAFNAANRASDGTTASSAEISRAATQAQIARLARIQPNGRIALELSPQAATMDDVPDVPLENADRISVPSKQAFVTVAGSVVNNNAFLWKPGRTAGDYIRIAGLDEGAELDNAFILRADGTVSHAVNARGLFGLGGVESQPLFPGDAVVVPNKLDYETWGRAVIRNLKDWSQLFANFGLGAAAIKTLRQ
jgi:protein involved in polysaccharide export with SLBB domain